MDENALVSSAIELFFLEFSEDKWWHHMHILYAAVDGQTVLIGCACDPSYRSEMKMKLEEVS